MVTRSSWKIAFLLGNVHVLVNLCTTYIIYVKQIYNLINMRLFGNKKTDEEIREEALTECNIFEGVRCDVIFPDTQLKIGTHSGLAKGAATLAFGFVGLAATSGVKHTEENRRMITIIQVVEKGVVFKKATEDNKDLRIPYESIVKAEHREGEPKNKAYIILLENQDIELRVANSPSKLIYNDFATNHLINIINERACGAQYEEAGWGLEHATAEPQETKQESNSLMDELERLGNMYEKGLLTDEEFKLAKSKLLEYK